jgi:adenylate cyclase
MALVPSISSAVRDVFQRPDTTKRQLPKRVEAAIERQENTSEILIKLIQISIFGLWGILYALSPKLEGAVSLVPYVLVVYLAMNIFGLFWALRWGLPDWAVYINVLIDMSMLMVLIWSFHIQYDQPPSFYLKAPTAFYIFIFIALRALRFQVRFVVAAGIVAIIGWSMLTAYVVFSDPDNTMITRNYVEYLTSNSVLIGAEVDKIIAILFVTGIMALAISRARKLLVRAVTDGAAAQDLSRFFDRSVADQITGADHTIESGEGVRRNAAILFTDIRGFTPMAAKMNPSDAVCLLSEYQKRIVPIVQKHGGSIDKFLGDGIMASFGAVAPSDTYAADALRAVDEIVAETECWKIDQKLHHIAGEKINVSVAQGPVVFGVLGGETRLEYTTIGDAVNLSAKLEKCNKEVRSRALTNQQTLKVAQSQGYEMPGKTKRLSRFVESVGEKLDLVVLYKITSTAETQ